MQGFILRLQKVKDEDLIVSILTRERLETLYRFYGARHSTINLGYMVDFEIEHSVKTSIGRLRDVVHLGFPWLGDLGKTRLWHQYVSLFYPHFRESEESGSFYFDLLYESARLWSRQNPKRVAVESYIKLLTYEGRLPESLHCFFCENGIDEGELTLIRAFLPAHTACCHHSAYSHEGITELFTNNTTLFLDDEAIERLWFTLLEGL